ncbi:MAG: hypothetical protein R6U26_01135 [Candidatus Undinarchaeales archaeon]
MKLPGIKEDMLEDLGDEDTEAILNHIKKVKEAIKKKKDLIEGKTPEITEAKPENEIEKLGKLLGDIESEDEELISDIKRLKEETEELLNSVKKEIEITEKVEKYKGSSSEELQEEMENELVIGEAIEHQLNILQNIISTSKSAIKKAVKLKDKHKTKVGNTAENLNDMAMFIVRIIFNEELPHLSVAYSLLKLDEWPEVEAKIQEIRTRFEMLGPKEP